MNYKFFCKGNAIFLIVPVGTSFNVLTAMLKSIPNFSRKRKIYRVYVFIIMLIWNYLLRFFVKNIYSQELAELLKRIQKFFDNSEHKNLIPFFICSTVPNRNRFYIHFFTKNGDRKFFGKLTTNKKDFQLLKNENDKLLDIGKQLKYQPFTSPKVVYIGGDKDYKLIVVESIPQDYKLFHPTYNEVPLELMNAIQGKSKKSSLNVITNHFWWKEFLEQSSKTKALFQYIENTPSNEIVKVSQVHGDFGSENILINREGKFMVIDWERYTAKGPHYTDLVAFWLGSNHRKIKNGDLSMIKKFNKNFKDVKRIDLALALGFLVGVNFHLAILLAQNFNDSYDGTVR